MKLIAKEDLEAGDPVLLNLATGEVYKARPLAEKPIPLTPEISLFIGDDGVWSLRGHAKVTP